MSYYEEKKYEDDSKYDDEEIIATLFQLGFAKTDIINAVNHIKKIQNKQQYCQQIISYIVNTSTQNNSIHKDSQEKENKGDEDDCDEESIVTGNDSRERVTKSTDKHKYIIRCIGELSIQFRYTEKDYKPKAFGTATVYHVHNKRAYAITAAHNTRLEVKECTDCDIYMSKKKINCQKCGSNQYIKTIIIKATEIKFTRNEINAKTTEKDEDGANVLYEYGDAKQSYVCSVEYIPDDEYRKAAHVKSGNDFAIISFKITDDYNYRKYSKYVFIENEQNKLENKQIDSFNIWGYPYYENKIVGLLGMHSTTKKYEVKKYDQTGNLYLEQKEIDTSGGQSGASLWHDTDDDKAAKIFAIHTGGSSKYSYNVATIINSHILAVIQHGTESKLWQCDKCNHENNGGYNCAKCGIDVIIQPVIEDEKNPTQGIAEDVFDDSQWILSDVLSLNKGDKLMYYDGHDDVWRQYTLDEILINDDVLNTLNELELFCLDRNTLNIFEFRIENFFWVFSSFETCILFQLETWKPCSSLYVTEQIEQQQHVTEQTEQIEQQIGASILIENNEGITSYIIMSYDASTTKAILKDNNGYFTKCFLKQWKVSINDNANRIEPKPKDEEKEATTSKTLTTRLGKYYNISSINGDWFWIKRTNAMKLKWISYKNTLLATIAAATRHLYPISLDYKTLMFISGQGLGNSWCDESLQVTMDDNIEMNDNLQLFLGESQIPFILAQIAKYSYYKFEVHKISEMINSENSMDRILELEAKIVTNLNKNICTITNDERGHLALIVGYIIKPPQNMINTHYYFKLKKFVDINTKDTEYIAIDLYNQHLVITMEPPEINKKYSISHCFNPSMLLNIVNDTVNNYTVNNHTYTVHSFHSQQQVKPNIIITAMEWAREWARGWTYVASQVTELELFGRAALKQMIEKLGRAENEEPNNQFAKLTVYTLMKLYDSRSATRDFINYLFSKINYNETDKELWKFADVTDKLKVIETCCMKQMDTVRKLQLFEQYILFYDGSSLSITEWDGYHRSCLKDAFKQILIQQEIIINIINKINLQKKLKYLNV